VFFENWFSHCRKKPDEKKNDQDFSSFEQIWVCDSMELILLKTKWE
jgi:hypothetical protein